MFAFEFMRHAFLAATLVGALCGITGWFLVLRGQSFAGHALSHIAFAGAAGAVLIGWAPILGMALAAALAGLVLGWEEGGRSHAGPERPHRRDAMTGLVLAASLGCGALFLQRANASVTSATALLFGNVFGVDSATLAGLCGLSAACLAGLAVLARPLLFASLDPDLAAGRGVNLRAVSLGFTLLVALSSAACAEVTGVLLVFSLLIGPAATTLRLALSPWAGMLASAGLGVGIGWAGIALSWWTDAPVSFWIGGLALLAYATATIGERFSRTAPDRSR